jgi:hypothetical protein
MTENELPEKTLQGIPMSVIKRNEEIFYLMNKLLSEYGKCLGKPPWEGDYPSPFVKSQNDIIDFIEREIQRGRDAEREKINAYSRKANKNPKRMEANKHRYHIKTGQFFDNCSLCGEET